VGLGWHDPMREAGSIRRSATHQPEADGDDSIQCSAIRAPTSTASRGFLSTVAHCQPGDMLRLDFQQRHSPEGASELELRRLDPACQHPFKKATADWLGVPLMAQVASTYPTTSQSSLLHSVRFPAATRSMPSPRCVPANSPSGAFQCSASSMKHFSR
jgi:hypothetical protein